MKEKGIQFFGILLDEHLHPLYQSGKGAFSFEEDARPLDIYDYWSRRGEESYKVFLTKVAYAVNTKVSFFSEERLSNVAYISETLPEYTIKQLAPKRYEVDCGFFGPSFTYDLSFYRAPYQQSHIQHLLHYASVQNPELGTPTLATLHHNYNYSKVMMQRTSKMSVALTCYYPYQNSQTLVVNYTLNYIYELPPNFLGGYDLLIKKIKEGISDLITQTRTISS
jgi:hypothetical protein